MHIPIASCFWQKMIDNFYSGILDSQTKDKHLDHSAGIIIFVREVNQ